MISVNTNTASSLAAYNISSTNAQLQKSLQRLSSGSRINSSSDDAGGLAVSMKLSAAIRRTEATQANVSNAISFLQTQDGVLKNADKVLSRMAELAQLATDVTKSTNDLALYQTEVDTLKSQLGSLITEEFNGIDLFGGTNATGGSIGTHGILTVYTSQDGTQSVSISALNLAYLSATTGGVGTDVSTNTASGVNVSTNVLATAAVATLNTAIQNLATLRATNGSQQSRLAFANDMLGINKVNLESANGRIADVDIAAESANLARLNILQQAGTAMLAQANQSPQSILRLLV
jgi:flagellin